MAPFMFFALQMVDSSLQNSATLAQCRPALARKLGEIQDADVTALSVKGRWRIIHGTVTAFVGMGAAGSEMANPHHLVRSQFYYVCSVKAGRVRKLTVSSM